MIFIADKDKYRQKEELYLGVRELEGRVISVDTLKRLPYLQPGDAHAGEWAIRARSYERFKKYLKNFSKGRRLNILDLGCGNGWMANRLYEDGYVVMGVDLNIYELQQAEAVFGSNERLQWIYADVLNGDLSSQQYDIILLNASCQYFPDLDRLLKMLLAMLSNNGEIHLLDSIFYNNKTVAQARERTDDYYNGMGVPAMSAFYFHHSSEGLYALGFRKCYPRYFFQRSVLQWWKYKKR